MALDLVERYRPPLDLPIELLPAYANTGEVLHFRFIPTYLMRRCHECDVEWYSGDFGITSTICWCCGQRAAFVLGEY